MDENLFFMMCVLALIVVFLIIFIYSKNISLNEGLENKQMKQHIETDHQNECEGDKCIIQRRKTNKHNTEKCV
jgi:cell division protein FtsL